MRCWEKYVLHARTILDDKDVSVSDPSMNMLLEEEDYDEILIPIFRCTIIICM